MRNRVVFAHKGISTCLADSRFTEWQERRYLRHACPRPGKLLTVHIPFCNNFIVQTRSGSHDGNRHDVRSHAPPIRTIIRQWASVPDWERRDTEAALLEQIESCQTPMVVGCRCVELAGRTSQLHRPGVCPKAVFLLRTPKN